MAAIATPDMPPEVLKPIRSRIKKPLKRCCVDYAMISNINILTTRRLRAEGARVWGNHAGGIPLQYFLIASGETTGSFAISS